MRWRRRSFSESPRTGWSNSADRSRFKPMPARPFRVVMLDAAVVLAVVAGLLVVVAIGQPLAARMRLPSSVLLAAIGVAIGGLPLLPRLLGLTGPFDVFISLFANLPVTSVTFIYVFLPLLVFEAGFATDVRRTLDDAAPILLLAVIATVITTAVIGLVVVAARRTSSGRMPAARRGGRNHRSGGRHCNLSGRRRAGTAHPAGRRRGAAQRCRRDLVVRGSARDDHDRASARCRGWVGRICCVVCRRRRFRDLHRPGSGIRDGEGARRSSGGGLIDDGVRLPRVHCRREAPACLRRRCSIGLRPDGRRTRPLANRAIKLGVPERALGANRVLGALADLSCWRQSWCHGCSSISGLATSSCLAS